ncbi:hypothetical protein BDN72DRAFT_845129 [Pluteus cervinus]|uniref:Uncharacterized protein n=1 Tax=Pluteus cervinus TaxID=181527 RepID=A0ACD3AJQ2_9AGAR|nr:hypothetical protein BDN72DRAFT_845129 [Pluteus cervinus]
MNIWIFSEIREVQIKEWRGGFRRVQLKPILVFLFLRALWYVLRYLPLPGFGSVSAHAR